jgi:hypothetical protein
VTSSSAGIFLATLAPGVQLRDWSLDDRGYAGKVIAFNQKQFSVTYVYISKVYGTL